MPDMTLANIANANCEKIRREKMEKKNNTIETIKDVIGVFCLFAAIFILYVTGCMC